MRLASEIMRVLSVDGTADAVLYTVADGAGGYFQNVKRLLAFSETEVVVRGKRGNVRVTGRNLSLGGYCAGDLVVRGDIHAVSRED